MTHLFYAVGLIMLICGSYTGSADKSAPTDCDGSEKALQAVRQDFGTKGFSLRGTVRPALEDDILFLKTEGEVYPKQRLPMLKFYEVDVAPYIVRDEQLIGQSVELDNHSKWLVAVDSKHDETFLLLGTKDPVAGFNALMKYVDIRIPDILAALRVFDFYLKAVHGDEYRDRVVSDDLKLESVALADFRQRYPEGSRRRAFDRWWESLPAGTRNQIKPPAARQTKAGFDIHYFLYECGSIKRLVLHIDVDGTVKEFAPGTPR